MDLDADINQYLLEPDHHIFHRNYSSHSITLRRLLSHSASVAVDPIIQSNVLLPDDAALKQATLSQILFQVINPNASSWVYRNLQAVYTPIRMKVQV
jgi:CubicO group peptidase (beta-lactamase class C family)